MKLSKNAVFLSLGLIGILAAQITCIAQDKGYGPGPKSDYVYDTASRTMVKKVTNQTGTFSIINQTNFKVYVCFDDSCMKQFNNVLSASADPNKSTPRGNPYYGQVFKVLIGAKNETTGRWVQRVFAFSDDQSKAAVGNLTFTFSGDAATGITVKCTSTDFAMPTRTITMINVTSLK